MMVMNPKNGEILAMASNSTFDLNDPQNLASMYSEQKIAAMTDKEKKRKSSVYVVEFLRWLCL